MKITHKDDVKMVFETNNGLIATFYFNTPTIMGETDKYNGWNVFRRGEYLLKFTDTGEFILMNPPTDEFNTQLIEDLIATGIRPLKCGPLPFDVELKLLKRYRFKKDDNGNMLYE